MNPARVSRPKAAPKAFKAKGRPKEADPVCAAAMATGILLIGVIPLILGLVGLARTRKPGVHGRGLAWTGVILGAVATVGWLALFNMIFTGNVDDFDHARDVAEPGVCIQYTSTGMWADARAVPCNGFHTGEIVAVFDLADASTTAPLVGDDAGDAAGPEADFFTADQLAQLARAHCPPAFALYLGGQGDDHEQLEELTGLTWSFEAPDALMWQSGQAQDLVCIANPLNHDWDMPVGSVRDLIHNASPVPEDN